MATVDNNITIAVGPAVSGERSFLLQTAGLVLYPFSLVPFNVDGRSNLDSLKASLKGNRTLAVFPEIPKQTMPMVTADLGTSLMDAKNRLLASMVISVSLTSWVITGK